ncbi:MAG: nucleotidyltransferase domain-containing protein, partial [Pseudomonadota bacterium]|nr:nucleotidyltransferase domain-containing protein [Pseudomonadota bacterium]
MSPPPAASALPPGGADDTTARLRSDYRQRKADLLAAMHGTGLAVRRVRQALARLSALTDDTLRALWQAASFCPRCALLAVGGYGRGELFPYSDVDVLVLLPPDADPTRDEALRQRIEAFITRCWDVGLEIGSSVRTADDSLALAAEDVTVQTALLEARLIAGDRQAFKQFQQRFMARMDPLAFFTAKRLEMRQRHLKYEDTPYALEPNCKESPGGLRDLQVILWVARAAGLGHHWQDLARAGVATPHEARQLRHNEALLATIRARLHLIAKRREDRLVFDLQNAVAESFGLQHRFNPEGRLTLRASEVLMRRYYWAAKAVTQLSQILLQGLEETLRARQGQAAPALRPINPRFFDKGGLIEVASDDLYQRQPHAILETFLLYAQTEGLKGLSARTLRALYHARTLMNPAFRADPVNRQTFLALLQQPQGITHALRLMNQTSVLGRYLWPFRRIVGQMQHDLFHVYTVDQHILMVVRNMRRFFMAEHAHEYPFCSQLAAGWDKPW